MFSCRGSGPCQGLNADEKVRAATDPSFCAQPCLVKVDNSDPVSNSLFSRLEKQINELDFARKLVQIPFGGETDLVKSLAVHPLVFPIPL